MSFLPVTAAPHKPGQRCSNPSKLQAKVWQRHPLSHLHVNIYDTKRSQTGEKQFWSRLLSSLRSRARILPPPSPAHPAPQTELKVRSSEAGAEMSEDGIGVTWQAFITPFTTPCRRRHGGDAERKRCRDSEPQVPTSLADKSNLSVQPLTPEVAMEPSSQAVDGACWDAGWRGGEGGCVLQPEP